MKFLKGFATFCFGGLAYGLLEICWRDSTHISMFFAGGLCYLIISAVDGLEIFGGGFLAEAPVCALAITAVELAAGLVVNVGMGLCVWDYSALPLNFMGQICLPFSAIWFALSVPAIVVSRLMKCFVFGEELPALRLLPERRKKSAAPQIEARHRR